MDRRRTVKRLRSPFRGFNLFTVLRRSETVRRPFRGRKRTVKTASVDGYGLRSDRDRRRTVPWTSTDRKNGVCGWVRSKNAVPWMPRLDMGWYSILGLRVEGAVRFYNTITGIPRHTHRQRLYAIPG